MKRQRESINLIPSENHSSKAVLEALGTVMSTKYAEGDISKSIKKVTLVPDIMVGLSNMTKLNCCANKGLSKHLI